MNKQKYLAELHEGVVEVTFKKVSGSTRTMNCTLNGAFLPPADGNTSNRVKNDDVCNVWSVDDGGWRSFRWDSIIDWSNGQSEAPLINHEV